MRLLPLLILMSICAGCLEPVSLRESVRGEDLPLLAGEGRAVKVEYRKKQLTVSLQQKMSLKVEAEKFTLPYDSLMWRFTKIPIVESKLQDGSSHKTMLDTGMPWPMSVDLETVADHRLPSRLKEGMPSLPVAWIESFQLGGTRFGPVLARVEATQWQIRAFGLPLYRGQGFIVGTPMLAKYSYIEFDNAAERVTFSPRTPFVPSSRARWDFYPILME